MSATSAIAMQSSSGTLTKCHGAGPFQNHSSPLNSRSTAIRLDVEVARHDGSRDIVKPHVVVARVPPDGPERAVQVSADTSGHVTLRLLDDDARGQGSLELIAERHQVTLAALAHGDVVPGQHATVAEP